MTRRLLVWMSVLLLLATIGCARREVPADYARIVVRNASETESVTIEVSNADGDVVLSETLEPRSSANARSMPGPHAAIATVVTADGTDGASYDAAFDVTLLATVAYHSASDDAEAGLSVRAPEFPRHHGDDGEGDDGEGDDGEGDDGDAEDAE